MVKAMEIKKERIIQLEMNEREARILQELIQNTMYDSLKEEPQDITTLRYDLFYAIKDVLDGDDK